MPEIRVLLVDDHAVLRDGLRSLLDRQENITVVGEAGDGSEALSKVSELMPNIVLMDMAMPVMNGIEATRQIKELYPQIKVLILTQHDNREYISPALHAGASGYVLKRSGGKEVIQAIRQVYDTGAFLEPEIARQIIDNIHQEDHLSEEPVPHLTEREMEVLKLVVSGKSNKEIAKMLFISDKTVSVHRSNIMAKLNVHNSFELIRYVNKHRLFDLGLDEADF